MATQRNENQLDEGQQYGVQGVGKMKRKLPGQVLGEPFSESDTPCEGLEPHIL